MGVRQQDGIDLRGIEIRRRQGVRQPAPCTQRVSIAAIDQNRYAAHPGQHVTFDRHARNGWKLRCREQPLRLLCSDVLTQNVEGPVFETIVDHGDDEIANPSSVDAIGLLRGNSQFGHCLVWITGSTAGIQRQPHHGYRPGAAPHLPSFLPPHAATPQSFGLGRCVDYCRRSPNLPHTYACSTIGPTRLNFRVRDGNGCDPRGKLTGKILNFAHAIVHN